MVMHARFMELVLSLVLVLALIIGSGQCAVHPAAASPLFHGLRRRLGGEITVDVATFSELSGAIDSNVTVNIIDNITFTIFIIVFTLTIIHLCQYNLHQSMVAIFRNIFTSLWQNQHYCVCFSRTIDLL